jgi:hypothetical protein
MTRTIAAVAVVAALAVPAAAQAAPYLSIREAKAQTRAHLRAADELDEVT